MKPSLLLLALTSSLFAAERPQVTVPRQTSGDTAVQPMWEETLTITVGTKDADIVGNDQRAIQAAVDHVARLGGGTVRKVALIGTSYSPPKHAPVPRPEPGTSSGWTS